MDATDKKENVERESGETADNNITFMAPECPVEKVTVYLDRAEVCRRVEATLLSGLNEIVIKKLPDMVDPGSIRVEGKGEATILEVVFHSEAVPAGEADVSAKEKELNEEKEALEKEDKVLDSQLDVLKKQWELLDGFAKSASAGSASKQGDKTAAAGPRELNDTFFQGLTKFLQLYADEGNSLEKRRLELREKSLALKTKIQANTENRRKLRAAAISSDEIKKCVIIVESQKSSKVSLLVSYVTSCASWKPSYDIRMYSAENQLKITYYGQIQQSTGEDWVDAKLFLSTAMPSIGGDVPELFTAELRVQTAPVMARKSYGITGFPKRRSFRAAEDLDLRPVLCSATFDEGLETGYGGAAPMPKMSHAETKVGEGVATTMYEIARCSTIPSDNVEHKVTVGLVDVKPKISYTSIPQRVSSAFMLAKVTNSSPYTFLEGETSIFMDNTFVGKASIKDVYPMEEFECSLGVDPAVKITYKPQKKYLSSSGLISKTTSNTHEQVIEVKNTHDYAITIKVTHQLPRSGDERIKVLLLEPQIDQKHPEKSRDKDVTLNKRNNLEWTCNIKAQDSREINLKYTVEHPARNTVYTRECVEHRI